MIELNTFFRFNKRELTENTAAYWLLSAKRLKYCRSKNKICKIWEFSWNIHVDKKAPFNLFFRKKCSFEKTVVRFYSILTALCLNSDFYIEIAVKSYQNAAVFFCVCD